MNAVFADAFYIVARLNRHDQHHVRTLAFSRDFRAHLLTTDCVLMEVADALAESESRARIRQTGQTGDCSAQQAQAGSSKV